MKPSAIPGAIAAMICLSGGTASAADIFIEDRSTPAFVCDMAISAGPLAGACLAARGPLTFTMTIVTQPDEFAFQCVAERFCAPRYETYVVALYRGQSYLFGQMGWQLLPDGIEEARPSFPWRAPAPSLAVDTRTPYANTFQLQLGLNYHGADLTELPEDGEIYVGISPLGSKVFTPTSVWKIWPRP